VAFGVAQPEQRRNALFATADLWIDVHAGVLQLRVVAVDVLRVQADARLTMAGLPARRRGRKGDGGLGVAGGDLDPPVLVPKGNVDALLEAKLVDVELDLPIL